MAAAMLLGAAGAPALACEGTHSLGAGRFHDNGDGTVSDTVSMLVWMRCAAGQQWQGARCGGAARALSLPDAQQLADTTNRDANAFHNDWRLPSLRELATLAGRGCTSPRTDAAMFPDTPSAAFWSATPRPGDAARQLALHFGADGVRHAPRDERLHVRLVRTGP